MNTYEKQASDFLKRHNAKMTISFIGKKVDPWGNGRKELHNQYHIQIRRNGKSYSATFTDSVYSTMNNELPSEYDILACLEKYEPMETVEDFADEFGYTIDSDAEYRRVAKIHKAVQREYNGMVRLFGDCMEELREIQ